MTDETIDSTQLCPADQAALDALVDAGFDADAVPEAHRARARRIAADLSQLAAEARCVCPGAESRCLAAIRLARAAGEVCELVPADEDALELLVQHRFDPRRVPSGVRQRAAHQAEVLGLLGSASKELAAAEASGRESLISRTLSRVQTEADAQAESMRFSSRPAPAARRWRVPDLVSVAAMLLIGVSILWPVMSASRERSRLALNETNLRNIGLGMGLYSGSNDGALPMATASLAGTPWWFVGNAEQSNSANLYTLVRDGYACRTNFAAPGNRASVECTLDPARADWGCIEEVPYSYQNQFARKRPVWRQAGEQIVLADRSPVILRAVRGLWVDPLENSPNASGKGQHALRLDGAVVWLTSPVLASGDNIWLPRSIEDVLRRAANARRAEPLRGVEQPECETDVFLVP